VLTQSRRWNHGEMRRDSARRGLRPPDEATVRERFLGEGVDAPDLATMKDFIRFRAVTSRGKIVKEPTADSVNTFAEWFFVGFTRVTGTPTNAKDRSEVYGVSYQRHDMYGRSNQSDPSQFVRKTLTEEGVVVNTQRPKHLFTLHDLTRLLVTLWTQDDLKFIPERYRLQYTLIIRMYCWTGARIGAFFTGGLHYGVSCWNCFHHENIAYILTPKGH